MSGESKLPSEVSFTHLDEQLFDGADATKRDLVEYLDAVHARMLPCLTDRPLSVIRIRPGQPAFMQKNLPKYTPDWVPRVPIWAEASRREVSYALCNDRRTLLWFANQRALEYHVTSSGLIAGTSRTIWYSILIHPKEQASRSSSRPCI
jgi:DNA primase